MPRDRGRAERATGGAEREAEARGGRRKYPSRDRLGEHAQDRPVHFQEVVATLYHNLGIDTARATIADASGRPQYLVEREPIRELI